MFPTDTAISLLNLVSLSRARAERKAAESLPSKMRLLESTVNINIMTAITNGVYSLYANVLKPHEVQKLVTIAWTQFFVVGALVSAPILVFMPIKK